MTPTVAMIGVPELLIIFAIIVLLAAYLLLVSVATDAIWFNSVGFGNVFWTRVGSQIAFFAGGTVITFLVLWINLWLAGKFIPKGQLRRFSLDDFLERFQSGETLAPPGN